MGDLGHDRKARPEGLAPHGVSPRGQLLARPSFPHPRPLNLPALCQRYPQSSAGLGRQWKAEVGDTPSVTC